MRKDFKKEGTYLSTLWGGYWKYKKLEEELENNILKEKKLGEVIWMSRKLT